jgi:uncharacterized protein (UPF0261 family)
MKSIAIIVTLDTKGPEADYLKSLIGGLGFGTVLLDTGILGTPSQSAPVPDLSADEIARAGGEDRRELVLNKSERGSRDRAIRAMCRGAAFHLKKLHDEGRICGAIGLGGAQGTEICTYAMRALPIGVPKVMISTVASGTTPFGIYTGTRDLTIMHSVVDIMGLNSLTRRILANGAAAIAGMAGMASPESGRGNRRVGLTLYGQTTPAGMALKPLLEAAGYEVFAFHSNGTGGKAMEELAGEGFIDAIFDLSTHELTDELFGGIHRGDGDRLLRGGLKGVPRLVLPGAVDIITLGEPHTIPEAYRGQPSVPHNPHITLVRISPEQSRRLAEVMAERLNRSRGPVRVVIPWGGFSFYNREGLHFRDLEADRALVDTLKERLRPDIPVHEFQEHVNDPGLTEHLFRHFEGLFSPT